MGLSKLISVALLVAIILCLQEFTEGKSFTHTVDVEDRSVCSEIKDFIHGVIIEIGHRVGVLEPPGAEASQEEGGSISAVLDNNANNNFLNNQNENNFYVYDLWGWRKKK